MNDGFGCIWDLWYIFIDRYIAYVYNESIYVYHYTRTHTYIRTYVHTYIHIYIYLKKQTYTHAHTHTYIYIYTYTVCYLTICFMVTWLRSPSRVHIDMPTCREAAASICPGTVARKIWKSTHLQLPTACRQPTSRRYAASDDFQSEALRLRNGSETLEPFWNALP